MPDSLAEPIKILLIDDHVIVRAGLRMLLENHDGMIVVGEA
ncbi:MAG TPA: DNA-binding response regulator, partial [Blastocatellia bacterium]|nr:DNA-binding response regulator [Blastocatellia bacterium]